MPKPLPFILHRVPLHSNNSLIVHSLSATSAYQIDIQKTVFQVTPNHRDFCMGRNIYNDRHLAGILLSSRKRPYVMSCGIWFNGQTFFNKSQRSRSLSLDRCHLFSVMQMIPRDSCLCLVLFPLSQISVHPRPGLCCVLSGRACHFPVTGPPETCSRMVTHVPCTDRGSKIQHCGITTAFSRARLHLENGCAWL